MMWGLFCSIISFLSSVDHCLSFCHASVGHFQCRLHFLSSRIRWPLSGSTTHFVSSSFSFYFALYTFFYLRSLFCLSRLACYLILHPFIAAFGGFVLLFSSKSLPQNAEVANSSNESSITAGNIALFQ